MERGNAIELLKAYGINTLPGMPEPKQLLACWARDKELSVPTIIQLGRAEIFGSLVNRYLLGNSKDESINGVLNYFAKSLKQTKPTGLAQQYRGSRRHNQNIDHALSESIREAPKKGVGASTTFLPVSYEKLKNRRLSPKIAVIGYGAAGILVVRALSVMGFGSITTFEKSKRAGIWSRDNVAKRSRNNPFTLTFHESNLQAAPGSGESVRSFLESQAFTSHSTDAVVEKIIPGNDFNHKVLYKKAGSAELSEETFDIVINCSGVGEPRKADDRSRMATDLTSTALGERWQREIRKDEAKRKHFTFVGLGNSTAEMLRQIHTLQDDGADMDYTILTHYPKDAIENPESTVFVGKRPFRVFRDISVPDLTSYQGDLPESRYDYYRALRTGKIVSDVKSWNRFDYGNHDITYRCKDGYCASHRTASLFTLIGYQPSQATLQSFGMQVNAKDHCAEVDYDGEVQTGNRDGNRLYKGYFAFGAMMANPTNKNAIVIPGMLFRLPDLLTTLVLRAAEAAGRGE